MFFSFFLHLVGNVLLVENDYTCVVCDDNEVDPDLQCCWCQKGLHESCMPAANEVLFFIIYHENIYKRIE